MTRGLATLPPQGVSRREPIWRPLVGGADRETGMDRELDRNLLAGIGLIAALVLINAGISLWNTRKVHDNASRVAHTHEVLAACGGVRADVRDLEATQRNFVLLGDDRSLDAFRQADGRTRDWIARLAEMTGDNASQQARIADLEALVRRAVGQMNTTIEVRQQQGLEPARQIVIAGNSRRLLDDIDRALDECERAERALLQERN